VKSSLVGAPACLLSPLHPHHPVTMVLVLVLVHVRMLIMMVQQQAITAHPCSARGTRGTKGTKVLHHRCPAQHLPMPQLKPLP